jgi:hypothetical protein
MGFRFFVALAALGVAVATGACRRRATTEAASVDVGPCRDGSEWQQRHGTSCLCCHKEFGVAGSVAHDGGVATILITDSEGRQVEMAPNPYDNFFRHRQLTPPFRAQLTFADGEVRRMSKDAPHGSCNACHGSIASALGER